MKNDVCTYYLKILILQLKNNDRNKNSQWIEKLRNKNNLINIEDIKTRQIKVNINFKNIYSTQSARSAEKGSSLI